MNSIASTNAVVPSVVDAIPAPVRALAELFTNELASVKFPDVDAASLAAGVARLDAQQTEVARLEEELTRARGQFDLSRDELGRLAARAHAYARVYAEDNPPLQSRIDAIALPRARVRSTGTASTSSASSTSTPHAAAEVVAPRKYKKRSAKDDAPSQLFGDGAGEAASDGNPDAALETAPETSPEAISEGETAQAAQ